MVSSSVFHFVILSKERAHPLSVGVRSCPIHGLIYFPWSHPSRPGPSAASYIQFLRSWKLPRQVAIHIEVLAVLNIEFMKPLAAYRRGVHKFERTERWIFHRNGGKSQWIFLYRTRGLGTSLYFSVQCCDGFGRIKEGFIKKYHSSS